VPGQVDDRQRDPVDREHVDDADRGRAEETGEQQRVPSDRPHDERLEQSALGVSRDDAEGEEDGEDDAEEERREHREPEEEGARERACVDMDVRRRGDRRQAREDIVVREPEEDEEGRRQQNDDRKDLAPHGLPEAVAGDREDDAHETSSPTASR
jgi:hypothetical protein